MADKSGGKRDTIKTQALLLFARHGVDAVSVQDIATACEMSKPNLYAHFRSKDALILALFEEGYRDYGTQMTAAIAAAGPFPARLDRLVRLICHLHDADSPRFRFILMTQHANLPTAELGEANPIDILLALVTDAVASGEIPARDPTLVTALITGLVIQPATFIQYGRLPAPLTSLAADITAACLRAVT
jgi:AcrR family transcriptional regulator